MKNKGITVIKQVNCTPRVRGPQGVYQLVISFFPEISMSSRVISKKFPECLSGKMFDYLLENTCL